MSGNTRSAGVRAGRRGLLALLPVLLCPVVFSGGVGTAYAATLTNGGFEEATLAGWEFMGDVSVQGSGIGSGPWEGQYQALLTTLCDRNTGDGLCETLLNELPYSGQNASPAFAFVHDPSEPYENNPLYDFVGLYPPDDVFPLSLAPAGEGSALRRIFEGTAGATVAVDYNYLSMDGGGDPAFLVLLGLSPGSTWRLVTQLSNAALAPGSVRFCERVEGIEGGNLCPEHRPDLDSRTSETGFLGFSAVLPEDGLYQLGVVVFEQAEGSIPSGLLLDNLRVTAVPLPPAGWLLLTGVAWLARKKLPRKARRG